MIKTRQQIYAFILAAGASKRFGGIKLLAPMPKQYANKHNELKVESLIEHCVKQVHNSPFDAYSVILGANAEAIQSVLASKQEAWGFNTYINQYWQQGMGTSIATAVNNTSSSHIAICAADQIALTSQHFAALVAASRQHPNCIIAAHYSSRLGVPCIFPRRYFKHLQSLNEDKGAKDIIAAEIHNVVSVNLPQGSLDIDTPDDLRQFTC